MKKKLANPIPLFNPGIKKLLLTMKLASIILLLSVLQVSANVYSQVTVNLDVKSQSIREVIKSIEQQSQVRFFYSDDLLVMDDLIDIKADNKNIIGVLDDIFLGSSLTFKAYDNNLIVIAPRELLQQKRITGTIVDETGNPLPGVNVQIEGTTVGSISDISGKYVIEVPNDNVVLVFSFIGYTTFKEPVAGKTIVDVKLSPTLTNLEEVVVVGYGTQRKKDVTSAIAVVDAASLKKTPVANVTNALQGIAPGIEVQSNQGRPGEMPNVRIRGVSSTNNTEPLYVVDGVPMGSADVIPADIESMQVLKDAASCAIYGSRGANGVIIITTKSGRQGAPKVSLSTYYGVETAWKTLDLLNAQQWAEVITDVNNNGGSTIPALATDIVSGTNALWDQKQTDWQKEIFQTGAIQETNFDVSGGNEFGDYFFSANAYSQDGIIIDTKYKRYSGRMNSNWHTKKFKFGENMSFRYYTNEDEDANGGRATLEEMIKITPNIAVLNPNALGGYSGYDASLVGHDASNPVGSLIRRSGINYNKLFSGDLYAEYEILKDLTFRTTFGFNSYDIQKRDLTLKTDMTPKAYATTTLIERSDWNYYWVLENRLSYRKVFNNKHDLSIMGAYTSEASKNHWFQGQGSNLQTETNDVMSMLEASFGVSGNETEVTRVSMLGRLMYTYNGKYMLTANFRRDGSSKFGPDKKWGNFPSVSLAWRISEESFMKSIESISNLKVRSSYGIVGNDGPVSAYAYLNGLTAGTNYAFGTTWAQGVTLRNFNNPDLTWETVKQFDVGADLGLFKGKLELTADYYDKRTEDMLVNLPLAGSSGSSGTIARNAGAILNSGFEFSATVRHNISDFNFSVSASFATLHNEVTDIYNNNAITAGSVEFGSATRTEIGHPIGAFYGYKTLGVFPDQAAIDAYTSDASGTTAKIQAGAKPGDIKFADLGSANGGAPDGKIDANDRYYMGNPIPKLTYGFNINMDYKGFDLSIFFQGVSGNDIYAELVCWTQGMHNNFNLATDVLNRWTPTNTVTDIPRAVRNDPNGNINKISDRYIKDGSYMRLKNASLGYTIPKNVCNTLHISNVRVYLTGRNLLTFTKYPFYDPEIGSNAVGAGGSINTSRGIDNGYYPQPRTVIGGIQIDF